MEVEEVKTEETAEPKAESRKTRLDWLIADISEVEIDVTEELWASMLTHAMEFLSAGGRISWERWSMLGPASRLAFVEAAAALKIRSALEGGA